MITNWSLSLDSSSEIVISLLNGTLKIVVMIVLMIEVMIVLMIVVKIVLMVVDMIVANWASYGEFQGGSFFWSKKREANWASYGDFVDFHFWEIPVIYKIGI